MMRALFALTLLTLLSGCVSQFSSPGTYVITDRSGKPVAKVQTVLVKPQDVPPRSKLMNPVWWLQTGGTNSTWTAPLVNNGEPYLPNVHNQFARDLMWWLRNPAGNFVGFVAGFEGETYRVTGTAPVLSTTGRDAPGCPTGWRWSIINGWAPFVSYWGGKSGTEFYLGWRPASGGLGAKLVFHGSSSCP